MIIKKLKVSGVTNYFKMKQHVFFFLQWLQQLAIAPKFGIQGVQIFAPNTIKYFTFVKLSLFYYLSSLRTA